MKKGSIIGKRQIVLAVLVAALGVAVWLNMKYASTDGGFDVTGALNSSKYLGDAQYVNNASVEQSTESVTTSAADGESTAQTTAAAEDDYFAEARENRENTRKEALELIQDTLSDAQADSAPRNRRWSRRRQSPAGWIRRPPLRICSRPRISPTPWS